MRRSMGTPRESPEEQYLKIVSRAIDTISTWAPLTPGEWDCLEANRKSATLAQFKFLNVEQQSVITYTIEAGVQVWISDGDKKLLGRVKAFKEHYDEVMEQIKKTWIVSPMVRNTTRQANQFMIRDTRPKHSGGETQSSWLLTRTTRPGPNGWTG